ncbi:alkylmercury lyase domain-containing protein [Ditylenchus destructor]|nr:alkylmercury lyase domain-containing protein [Ditylenchus destructor]
MELIGDIAERVRIEIYREFAKSGLEILRSELAAKTNLQPNIVDKAYKHLATERHIVLDENGKITMAHPFATVNLGFSVMGKKTLWFGGCAWDSFALPHLLNESDPSVLVATTCPSCAKAHAWTVNNKEPPAGEQIAHFMVPVNHTWDDVVHTCSNQRVFCNQQCVTHWLNRTGNSFGYCMNLTTLWNLAKNWYSGRLGTPYKRREPSQAAEYFKSVGLKGPFWGS